MIFHGARIKNKYENTVQIQGNIIDHVNATQFLGIIIDNKLNWSDHINYIKNKISKSLGIIYKIRSFLNRITLRNLYHTFVFPYLIYGVEVWGEYTCYSFESHNKTTEKIYTCNNVFSLFRTLTTTF